jgi:hypothetical protein
MSATILHQNQEYVPEGDIDLNDYGTWVKSQDPLTGDVVRVWVPFEDTPTTPDNEATVYDSVPCLARGIVDGGIRVAGTTEWFGEDYRNIDFVKLWVPPHITISKRDRVTNIKDAKGRIRWVDEEYTDPRLDETPRATVFNVNGVTPLFSALNDLVEWYVMLERAEGSGEG